MMSNFGIAKVINKESIVNRITAAGGAEVSVLAIEQASNYIWTVFLTWEYGRAPGEGEQ